MTSHNLHFAHHCLVTLYLIPTDPPDGSPSCSVEPALNHTSLRLLCSWPGGFPSPSLHWNGHPKRAGQDEADTGQQTNPLTNTAILLPSEGLTSNDTLFTCMGSHLALQQSAECSTRTCKETNVLYCSLFSEPLTSHLKLFFSTRYSPCRAGVFCLCD